jgi:hydroxyacylglutathione hydrolase
MIQINEHLFSGDFIFKGTIGRFDFPNSDAKLMKQSLNKILKWKKIFIFIQDMGIKLH